MLALVIFVGLLFILFIGTIILLVLDMGNLSKYPVWPVTLAWVAYFVGIGVYIGTQI